MQDLAKKLPDLLLTSRATSTVSKYLYTFQRWYNWSESQHITCYPADPFHVALYLVHLLQEAVTATPVTAAMCAISWYHVCLGASDPCKHPLVQNTGQAAKRLLARPKSRKAPITKAMLLKLADSLLKSGSLTDLQLLTLVTLGYAGTLRWNDMAHIFADEVRILDQYMAIFLEARKNDQLRHGSWIFVSRWQGKLCPVALVEELMRRGGHSGHQPLFGRVSKRRGQKVITGAMSYSRARESLHRALQVIGMDATRYGLHSLRSGGASVAAAAGLPERLIKRHGGWRSDSAMHMYFEESTPALLRVSRALDIH